MAFLRHIKNFWYAVFDGDEIKMEKLDETTLVAMQLTAPGACEKEARQLYARIHGGELFSAFNETERNQIWLKICSATVDCLVPSMHAFFENIKYLEDAADCMRRLVRLEGKESIRCAFEKAFRPDTDDSECIVQTSPSKVKTIHSSTAESFDVAYRQLWLYALREYQNMPTERQKKLAIAQAREADEIVLFRFAHLAQTLGFNSENIEALVLQNPDEVIARRLLTTARKPEEFEYHDIASNIKTIVDILATARPTSVESQTDENDVESACKQPARCGRPHAGDHAQDKPYMFLDKLHVPTQRHRSSLTSYFIQRSIYFAFFGKDIGISVEELTSSENLQTLDFGSANEQELPPRRLEDNGRQVSLQRTITEQEMRLELLKTKEQELLKNIKQLENNIAYQESRMIMLRGEEQSLIQRINGNGRSRLEDELQLELLTGGESLDDSLTIAEPHDITASTPSRRTGLGQMVREALDEEPADATGNVYPATLALSAQEHSRNVATDAEEYTSQVSRTFWSASIQSNSDRFHQKDPKWFA